MLGVGDGNFVYWETCGHPDGKQAVVVPGGPGQGCSPNMRRGVRSRHVTGLFCSTNAAAGEAPRTPADPTTDMRHNTTEHLIADMERTCGDHLGIDREWRVAAGRRATCGDVALGWRRPSLGGISRHASCPGR